MTNITNNKSENLPCCGALDAAVKIASEVRALGGETYFVGGCVRDRIMGIESKDVDIEVHKIAPAILEKILDGVGEKIEVGASFGVYKLRGVDIDISMPREDFARGLNGRENERSRGHKDFDVIVNPFVGERTAASRRDFTVNAMMENVITGEILDFFGGRDDIKHKILRHVSDGTFADDPLRVLRGAQFAARLGFEIAEETRALSRSVDLSSLSRERVMGELEKAMLTAEKPSVFFRELAEMAQLSPWFCEVESLIGVVQGKKHHAEGDVFTHTMMVVDEAARRRGRANYALGYMLSALTHDFGKALTTTIDADGSIHAYGHDDAGVPVADKFIRRLTDEKRLVSYVKSMTKLHMKPLRYAAANSSVKATNALFDESADPDDLLLLSEADVSGSVPSGGDDERGRYGEFLSSRLEIYREYMARPYVKGQDLIDAGILPGEAFGEAMKYAHRLRLAGVDRESALKQTIAFARSAKKDDV
ncbi:MAG: tRNA nucleotidyltransferase [Firmicutes bacterium]|nr:tRNA nucleotidyltransferase [Bacillota bacterium]